MKNFNEKVADVLQNLDAYHSIYYENGPFRGPSLYFHQRSINTRNSENLDLHLEYIYATLASWGMHRMGGGGPKMEAFDIFRQSILNLKPKLTEAQTFRLNDLKPNHWSLIEDIFNGIRIMTTSVALVAHSKVMHHMLPNLVPPIDREYTLSFLYNNKNINGDVSSQWRKMQEMISGFFLPVSINGEFMDKARFG